MKMRASPYNACGIWGGGRQDAPVEKNELGQYLGHDLQKESVALGLCHIKEDYLETLQTIEG